MTGVEINYVFDNCCLIFFIEYAMMYFHAVLYRWMKRHFILNLILSYFSKHLFETSNKLEVL